jgi:hypothetical protein
MLLDGQRRRVHNQPHHLIPGLRGETAQTRCGHANVAARCPMPEPVPSTEQATLPSSGLVANATTLPPSPPA